MPSSFSPSTALVPFAIGLGALVITAILLVWNASARRAYVGPETVIFSRSPGKLIGGAAVIAVCAFAAPFVGIDQNNGIFIGLLIVGAFAIVWYLQFLLPSLTFYAADHTGLTRQVLAIKYALAWHDIDWVYPARKTTTYRTYGVKTGQSSEDALMVEAGANRKMKVLLKGWMIGGDARSLVNAIDQRATGAQFGFDKSPVVLERRKAGVVPGVR
ncbi:MAG TPA: hypothetical protein VIC85_03835 [Ktedonobacterales bacterium]|jgi:hypothetical protein